MLAAVAGGSEAFQACGQLGGGGTMHALLEDERLPPAWLPRVPQLCGGHGGRGISGYVAISASQMQVAGYLSVGC